jgi:hypothetical protein
MKTKPIAQCVNEPSDNHLGLSVLSPDTSHTGASFLCRKRVH